MDPPHHPLGRFTEPAPRSVHHPLWRLLGVIAAILTTFLFGALTALYLAMETSIVETLRNSPAVVRASAGNDTPFPEEPGPSRIQPASAGRLDAHLQPREEELQAIVETLRSRSLDAPGLMGTPLDLAQVATLLHERKGLLIDSESVLRPPPRWRSLLETLPGEIAYWRPVRLSESDLQNFIDQWLMWRTTPCIGTIIDLRFFRDGNNFPGAAAAAALFLPPGQTLFTLEGLNQPQQVFQTERQPLDMPPGLPLLILTNSRTRGAAEALAASLQCRKAALLLGTPTAGEGTSFHETKLSTGRFFRVASARLQLHDGTPLLGAPLNPDIPVLIDSNREAESFQRAFTNSAAASLSPPPPPANRKSNQQVLPQHNLPDPDSIEGIDPLLDHARDILMGIRILHPPVPPPTGAGLTSPPNQGVVHP